MQSLSAFWAENYSSLQSLLSPLTHYFYPSANAYRLSLSSYDAFSSSQLLASASFLRFSWRVFLLPALRPVFQSLSQATIWLISHSVPLFFAWSASSSLTPASVGEFWKNLIFSSRSARFQRGSSFIALTQPILPAFITILNFEQVELALSTIYVKDAEAPF